MLRLTPDGGQITEEQLSIVVNQLNSRIRGRGLSSWEILHQRDQYTGEQLDLNDLKLSEEQSEIRARNQEYSSKHKSRGRPAAKETEVQIGSLVYIKEEGDKNHVRDRYLVIAVGDGCCTVQKFVKSQLRNKRYQLKLTEIYPVLADEIELKGKIRGIDDIEDLGDQVDVIVPHVQNMIVEPVINYSQNVSEPTYEESGFENDSECVNIDNEMNSNDLVPVNAELEVIDEMNSNVTNVTNVESTTVETNTETDPNAVDSKRRSQRDRKDPAWMRSKDYVMW